MLKGLTLKINQPNRTKRGGGAEQGRGVEEDAGRGGQQGLPLCRVCQGAGMPPSAFTSHSTAQCGSLSAWDRMELYTALHGEFGQVEQFDDEGQESQPNSA